jgi:glycosyltransferase involved in cell wall biosynthesis
MRDAALQARAIGRGIPLTQIVKLETPALNRSAWDFPKVSIVVTHYNYSLQLREALLSVSDQTYTQWECVVVDDCSDELNWQRAQAIVQELADDRIRISRNAENVGQTHAFFAGLDQTSGPFVCLLDPDDRYHRDFLKEMVAVHLNETVFCPLVCCDQMLLCDGMLLTRTNSGHKLAFLLGGGKPHAVIEPRSDKLLYSPKSRKPHWAWTSTTSMMFRRAALNLIRPHKVLPYKGSADTYMAHGCHFIGGSIVYTKPLVYRGITGNNDWLSDNVYSLVQNKGKPSYAAIDPTPLCIRDVIAAIIANGAGHELPKELRAKKPVWHRWRRSFRKRLAGR